MNARREKTRNESRNENKQTRKKSSEKRKKWKIEFVLFVRILDGNLSRISCCEHIKGGGGATHHTTIIISKNTQRNKERERDGQRWRMSGKVSEREDGKWDTHMILSPFIFGEGKKERKKKDRVKLNAMLWHISWKNLWRQKPFHLLSGRLLERNN